MMTGFDSQRDAMVREQLIGRGIVDSQVLRAMRRVPRDAFVESAFRPVAYADRALPIDDGQTISQPCVVARMVDALALTGDENALEVGAGSGYAAAILAEICTEVYAIERIEALAMQAAARLDALGYRNVMIRAADGTLGWPERAPFDAILVSAGAPDVPTSLEDQLAIGGRMVIPIGHDLDAQKLVRITRVGEHDMRRDDLADVRFVPLIGDEGWRTERIDDVPN